MPKTIIVSCSDAEAGMLSFYRGGDSKSHVVKTFETDGPAGETIDRTLPELVTAGVITNAERIALVATLQKINSGLRTLAQLDPA